MKSKKKLIFRDGLPCHNPALLAIQNKGFELGIYPPTYDEGEEKGDDGEIGFWFARKSGREFIAGDPLSLLGLVAIWEERGDNWDFRNDHDIYDEVLTKTYGDE